MSLYSSPPPARPFRDDKPTLLVTWWITIFCTAIIALRLAGRYIRVEKLFAEDRIVAAALVPLYVRAACVHVVLRCGTNNVALDGLLLDEAERERRVLGSKLVLASRVFYALTLWILKFATMEFFGRLAGATRRKSHMYMITALRWFLVATFVAVVISDLAECQPLAHYWALSPSLGGQCRQAFVQLLTMGACNAATDLLLIAFPIPIILSSKIVPKRKVLLVLLFSLALVTVSITLYRLPQIVKSHGDQATRSMWASVELLAGVAVGNTVALGSFLRDSGAKRHKFRPGSTNSASQPLPSSRWEDEQDSGDDKAGHGFWDDRGVDDAAGSRRQSKSMSTGGRVSPTQSHDSLITRDQLGAEVQSSPYEPPERAVHASSQGVHRGSTVRLGSIMH